jgi:hypothetical protein
MEALLYFSKICFHAAHTGSDPTSEVCMFVVLIYDDSRGVENTELGWNAMT